MVELDRNIKDERDKDPIDLNTNKYKGGEELTNKLANKLANKIDKGIMI